MNNSTLKVVTQAVAKTYINSAVLGSSTMNIAYRLLSVQSANSVGDWKDGLSLKGCNCNELTICRHDHAQFPRLFAFFMFQISIVLPLR